MCTTRGRSMNELYYCGSIMIVFVRGREGVGRERERERERGTFWVWVFVAIKRRSKCTANL